jgi:hypothetical protein
VRTDAPAALPELRLARRAAGWGGDWVEPQAERGANDWRIRL